RYSAGDEILYTLTENAVEGYSAVIQTMETETGLESVITNTLTPEETTATVTKVWKDDNDADENRPDSVLIQLLANGEKHGEPVEVTVENDWTHTWTGLAVNSEGSAINYTVEEVNVITNTLTPEETTATVTKVWKDDNDADENRPDSVLIQLLANGEKHGEPVEVTVENDWTHTWTGLAVNSEGSAINYTVEEVNV